MEYSGHNPKIIRDHLNNVDVHAHSIRGAQLNKLYIACLNTEMCVVMKKYKSVENKNKQLFKFTKEKVEALIKGNSITSSIKSDIYKLLLGDKTHRLRALDNFKKSLFLQY